MVWSARRQGACPPRWPFPGGQGHTHKFFCVASDVRAEGSGVGRDTRVSSGRSPPPLRSSLAPPSLQGDVLGYCPELGPSSPVPPPDRWPGLWGCSRKAEAPGFLQVADSALGRADQSWDLGPRPRVLGPHPGPFPFTLPSHQPAPEDPGQSLLSAPPPIPSDSPPPPDLLPGQPGLLGGGSPQVGSPGGSPAPGAGCCGRRSAGDAPALWMVGGFGHRGKVGAFGVSFL